MPHDDPFHTLFYYIVVISCTWNDEQMPGPETSRGRSNGEEVMLQGVGRGELNGEAGGRHHFGLH